MSNKRAQSPIVWIVSGPSGSGKTTLCQALLGERTWGKKLLKSVSYTTRPLRKGETEGRDYHHVSEKEFLELKRKRAFLENEKIFGFYYGTPRKIIADARRRQKDVLLSIDVKGAQTVKKALRAGVVSIFILAPKLGDLIKRLRQRSTENGQEMRRRLKRVKMELAYSRGYDYIVINDYVKKALEQIKSILTAKRCDGDYVLRTIRTTH